MCKEVNMQFKHSYVSKEKMSKADESIYSSQFKSYIADGESALKDKIINNETRESVMQDVRRNLKERMQSVNDKSSQDAIRMQNEHQALRIKMQEALIKTKEATRQRKLLDAKMYAEQSKQSNLNAESAELKIENMLLNQKASIIKDAQEGIDEAEKTTAADFDQKVRDLEYLDTLKAQAAENKKVTHHKNMFSLFRAIGKKMERDSIADEQLKQEKIINEQKLILREKGKEWARIRQRYEKETYRRYYTEFDRAAAQFRVLNRNGRDTAGPLKDVKEYVGEFDMEKLEDTLSKLSDNPYLNVKVDVKDKKARNIDEADFIKSHKKITLMGEQDESGLRKRYKISGDFSYGYEARRQFSDKNHPTALIENKNAFQKIGYDVDRLKLQTDEKDSQGRFINSEDNLEIVQAEQKRGSKEERKTLNGVFLDGEFLSTNFNEINGLDDANLTSGYSKNDARIKEYVRRMVLKGNMFQHINSRTIQYAMGYGASEAAGGKKIQKQLIASFAKEIMSKKGLPDWDDETIDHTMDVAEFFEQIEEGKVSKETIRKNERIQLETNADKVKNRIFSKEYESKLFDPQNKDKEHKLPDSTMDIWEKKLIGDNKKEKKSLSTAVKTKVAFDVLRQEYAYNKGVVDEISDKNTRVGKILDAIKDDTKALIDLSLLLLSENEITDYWNMAKNICKNHLTTNFEKKVGGVFDSRFNRALAYGRSEQGMLMRIALIDELNANRSHFDPLNFFEALMPTSWKQYTENIKDQRGYGATFKQKLTDGTITGIISDVFSAYIDIADGMGSLSPDTFRQLNIARKYTSMLNSAIDMGAISEAGVFAISDLMDEEYTEIDEDGKESTKHTSDDRNNAISLGFTMVRNTVKLIKTTKKYYKNSLKEIERRQKKEPDYNPKEFLDNLNKNYYDFMVSASGIMMGTASTVSNFAGEKQLKSIFAMCKSGMSTVQDGIEIYRTSKQIGRIRKTEKEFSALENKDVKEQEDEEFLDVLHSNSQLQYGLSCAKRKNRDDRAMKIPSMISNAGKTILNFIKAFIPGAKKHPIFLAIDATWSVLMTLASTTTQLVRDRLGVRANIDKMMGQMLRYAPTSVLNDVLRREAGIVSIDYLTDLARIFMSLDTEAFMKEASTGAEKKIGAKIAKTLFNNGVFNENNLDKVDGNKLMGIMGVKGNFRGILKHSLA